MTDRDPLFEGNDVETMYLYTEKATKLIYEAQLFEDFALVRPVDPIFHSAVKKMTLQELGDDFDEYQGNWDEIRAFFAYGGPVSVTIM